MIEFRNVSKLYGQLEAVKDISFKVERGEMLRVLIEGTNGFLLIRSIGDLAILVVLADRKVRLGMLFYEVRQCVEKLSELL